MLGRKGRTIAALFNSGIWCEAGPGNLRLVNDRDESVMKPGVIVATTKVRYLSRLRGRVGERGLHSETPQEDKALIRRYATRRPLPQAGEVERARGSTEASSL